jgi:maltose/moltooligosaccharide transporter
MATSSASIATSGERLAKALKPALPLLTIINMAVGFFGLQIGFALQNGNASRIFQSLGADVDNLPVLWLAAPLTGLIVQPIVGYFSDRTWGRLGRRRPYFLAGAILATLALIFMPTSPVLWIAVGSLWILDAALNISMEPFRAFVGDNLNAKQKTVGYAAQGVMIGIGGFVGSNLPAWLAPEDFVGVENSVPDHIKLAFFIGGGLLFLSVLFTVLTSKEYSPEEMKTFESADESDMAEARRLEMEKPPADPKTFWIIGALFGLAAVLCSLFMQTSSTLADPDYLNAKRSFSIFIGLLAVTAILFFINALRKGARGNMLGDVLGDLVAMPTVMKRLAAVQFTSWFAFFIMWIYTVPAMADAKFGTTDAGSAAYDSAANGVYSMFGVYNLIPIGYAMLLPALGRIFGLKLTYAFGLIAGGLGLACMTLLPLGQGLGTGLGEIGLTLFATDYTLSAVLIGIAWTTVLVVPYSILAEALPAPKMGVYMGIFNFFIVVPQIVVATVMALVVKALLGGTVANALVLGGVVMALGAILLVFVPYKDAVKENLA